MIQNDTKVVLLPLLPEALHPAVRRLAEFIERPNGAAKEPSPVGCLPPAGGASAPAAGEVLLGIEVAGQKPSFPGWDVLRVLGGEVAEVSGFAATEELRPGDPVLLAGRFERRRPVPGDAASGPARFALRTDGGRRARPQPSWCSRWAGRDRPSSITATKPASSAKNTGSAGIPGPRSSGCSRKPSPANRGARRRRRGKGSAGDERPLLDWQDAVRCLELDDAARAERAAAPDERDGIPGGQRGGGVQGHDDARRLRSRVGDTAVAASVALDTGGPLLHRAAARRVPGVATVALCPPVQIAEAMNSFANSQPALRRR